MIQAVTQSSFDAYISTEDNRIDTSVGSDKIRHLVKFTNDMDKSVQYAYPNNHLIYDRYTKMSFTYNATPDVYTGDTKLEPSGYYKYEVYEVSWTGAVAISAGNAPASIPVNPAISVKSVGPSIADSQISLHLNSSLGVRPEPDINILF